MGTKDSDPALRLGVPVRLAIRSEWVSELPLNELEHVGRCDRLDGRQLRDFGGQEVQHLFVRAECPCSEDVVQPSSDAYEEQLWELG